MSITRSTSFKSSPGPNQVLDGCQENRDMKPKSKHPYIRLLVLELDITLINGLALRFRSPKREVSRFLNTNTTYTARLLTTHIVGHHDGEEGLVVRVERYRQRRRLEEKRSSALYYDKALTVWLKGRRRDQAIDVGD